VSPSWVRILLTSAAGLVCAILASSPTLAQVGRDTGQDTVFPHSQTPPFWLSAQGNFIFQWHPRFPADYSGPNSFEYASEQAASEVTTLYAGLQLDPTIETIADFESAGGSGLSQTLGLAGFTNRTRCGVRRLAHRLTLRGSGCAK
jgi:hypothetical protein